MVQQLTNEQREQLLTELSGWALLSDRDAIGKVYLFDDFAQAWAFMSKVAEKAEEMDHHPEWFNVYSRVEVTLSTHECGGLSERDIRIARFMDSLIS